MSDHVRALLTRLAAVEDEAREIVRLQRQSHEDLCATLETARQLRAELAAVVGVPDIATASDASRPADAIPTPEEYIRAIVRDPCGRIVEVRR